MSGSRATFAPRPVTRIVVGAISLTGACLSLYLAAFQLGAIGRVWEPLFHGGSRWVLTRSPLSRRLPDATLGVVAYLGECGLDLPGAGHSRWLRPWQPLLLGGVSLAMLGASLALTALQVLWHHWCSLCLASATLSLVIAVLVLVEVGPVARAVIAGMRDGDGLLSAVNSSA